MGARSPSGNAETDKPPAEDGRGAYRSRRTARVIVDIETPSLPAMSSMRGVSPSSAARASATCAGVSFGGRPIRCPRSLAAAYHWSKVAYGNGVFVAISDESGNQGVMTSPDGMSWVPATLPSNTVLEGVIYAGGQFVVAGYGNVYTSPDGTVWTERASTPSGYWIGLAFGNGRYVATGWGTDPWHPHVAMTSTDGVNWDPMVVPGDVPLGSVAYGNGVFVTAGSNGIFMAGCQQSAGCENPEAPGGALFFNGDHRVMQWCSGAQWQALGPINPTGPNDGCEDPAKPGGNMMFNADYCILQYCDGDTWRGIGELSPCACDPDAGTWTTHSIGEAGNWRGIAYGNGTFVAMAHQPATSGDGINWTVQSGSPASTVSGSIAFGNNLFVVSSQGGWTRDVWTSPDGINWTTHNNSLPPSAPYLGAMIFDGSQFVGVGGAGAIITSPDGVNWTEQTSSVTTDFTDIAYGNGRYVAVGGWGVSSHPVVTSTDAVNWTAVPSASVFNSSWNSVAYGNGLFVAKSYGGGPSFMYSSDGENWQAGNSGTYGTWWGGEFISFGDGLFVVAGAVGAGASDQTIYTSSDGINWSLQSGPGQAAIKRATYANGMFVGVNDGPSDMTVRATCLGGS